MLVEVYVASNTDISKTTIAPLEEAAMVIVAPQEEVMNNQDQKYVTQARASYRRRRVRSPNEQHGI